MSANVTKGHVGYMEFGVPASVGNPPTSPIVLPYTAASPTNPTNDSYMPSVNKSVGPSVVVRGMYTPAITVRAIPLEGWFTATNLNAMYVTDDGNYDTAGYVAHLVEPGGPEMKIAGLRWGGLSLSHSASGGMLGCELGGICTSVADSTTWGTSVSGVPGQAFGPSQVAYNSTAQNVRAWRLNVLRAQAYDMFSGGPTGATATRSPSAVSTGQIGGTFAIEFSPTTGVTIPTTSVSLLIYKAVGTLHLTITLDLNLDTPTRSYTTAFGNQVNEYTLIDYVNGGSPITFA